MLFTITPPPLFGAVQAQSRDELTPPPLSQTNVEKDKCVVVSEEPHAIDSSGRKRRVFVLRQMGRLVLILRMICMSSKSDRSCETYGLDEDASVYDSERSSERAAESNRLVRAYVAHPAIAPCEPLIQGIVTELISFNIA